MINNKKYKKTNFKILKKKFVKESIFSSSVMTRKQL